MSQDNSAARFGSITTQCVVALVLGVAVAQLPAEISGTNSALGETLRIFVRGWGNFFRLLAVPLTACLVFAAVLSGNSLSARLGRVSASVLPVFIALMIPGFVLSYLGVPALMSLLFPGLRFAENAEAPAAGKLAAQTYQWIDDVIPPNFFSAVVSDNILGVIVVTLVIAFALRQTAAPIARIAAGAQFAVDGMFVIAGWLLRLSPIVVFGVVMSLASESVAKLGGVMLAYVAIETALLIVLIGILLLLAMLAFRGSPYRLLRSSGPAMIAAMTTRSSLATVPLVIRSAKSDLGVNSDIAGYVASLGGALLKASRSISTPTRLLILSSVLVIPISFQQYVGFCLTVLVLSVSTSGIPKAVSGERSLSAFVAVGVPAGPATLLGSLTWATDPLMTLVNTLSYLTATLWVARVVPSPVTEPVSDVTVPGGTAPLAGA